MNISLTRLTKALDEIDTSSRREWSKKHALAKAVGPSCPEQSRREGRTASLTRGRYSQYVSANAAKSGKSVSPKVRETGENAAGGPFDRAQDMFFQHSQSNTLVYQ
ncbi:MAG: hypothetical protein VST68_05825 [Nitrospirota bacterium]|nr:hypothetical protein [Nitrospirota bacterium]